MMRRALGALVCLTLILSAGAAEAQDYREGELVEVKWQKAWYVAKVLTFAKGSYKIHYVEWEKSWDEWVRVRRVRTFKGYQVGDLIQVEWKGRYYKARIKNAEEARWFITYPGWDSKWDEWVTYRRMRRAR